MSLMQSMLNDDQGTASLKLVRDRSLNLFVLL